MSNAKQLRRYAAMLATDDNAYWMDAHGAWRLRPRCAKAIYKRLKAGKGTLEEYRQLCVMEIRKANRGQVMQYSCEE
jgi:hypothetical protein